MPQRRRIAKIAFNEVDHNGRLAGSLGRVLATPELHAHLAVGPAKVYFEDTVPRAGSSWMTRGSSAGRFAKPSSLVPLDIPLGAYGKATLHLVCAKSALEVPRVLGAFSAVPRRGRDP
jgi:hypothetical protein